MSLSRFSQSISRFFTPRRTTQRIVPNYVPDTPSIERASRTPESQPRKRRTRREYITHVSKIIKSYFPKLTIHVNRNVGNTHGKRIIYTGYSFQTPDSICFQFEISIMDEIMFIKSIRYPDQYNCVIRGTKILQRLEKIAKKELHLTKIKLIDESTIVYQDENNPQPQNKMEYSLAKFHILCDHRSYSWYNKHGFFPADRTSFEAHQEENNRIKDMTLDYMIKTRNSTPFDIQPIPSAIIEKFKTIFTKISKKSNRKILQMKIGDIAPELNNVRMQDLSKIGCSKSELFWTIMTLCDIVTPYIRYNKELEKTVGNYLDHKRVSKSYKSDTPKTTPTPPK